MSFHEPDSDVTRLNRNALSQPVRVDPLTIDVLRHAINIAEASKGVFDVTVADKMVQWGFLPDPDPDGSTEAGASWRDIELIGGDQVRFHRPLWLDLGGIAKGYAVDLAIDRMRSKGQGQYLVNAGGDLRISGPAPDRVQVEIPSLKGNSAPVFEIENGSIASSSGRLAATRRGGVCMAPHLDGRLRRPVGANSFVSVLAEKCVIADALTKVVLAKGRRCSSMLKLFNATALLHSAKNDFHLFGAEVSSGQLPFSRSETGSDPGFTMKKQSPEGVGNDYRNA